MIPSDLVRCRLTVGCRRIAGRLNERYTYTHTVLADVRNYAHLDISLGADGGCTADVKLVGVAPPASDDARSDEVGGEMAMREPDAGPTPSLSAKL